MIINVDKIRQKRAKLEQEMLNNFANGLNSNTGLMTDEQRTDFNNAKAKIDSLTREIEETERNNEREMENGINGGYGQYGNLETKTGNGSLKPGDKKDYRSMFRITDLDNGDFEDKEEFFRVLASGRYDERLQRLNKRAHIEGIQSDGGYSVPEELAGWLMDNALEGEVVRPRAKVYERKSNIRKIPGWNGFDNSNGELFGGFTYQWLGENSTATRSQGKLMQVALMANKLALYTNASNELLDDGLTFEEQLGEALIMAIRWGLDYAFLQGNGVAKPLGMLNDPALIEVDPEDGQGVSTILYENLLNMMKRLHPVAVNNAIWIANQTAFTQLMTMTIAVGTGGEHIRAVEMVGNGYRLLGKPLIFTEKVPQLGEKGDISIADFSHYAIGLRKDVRIDRSNAPGWTEDVSDFRAILRGTGQGLWPKAFTPRHGEQTSWCVTLGERK
jgi:HK97 family phage major capsid protein